MTVVDTPTVVIPPVAQLEEMKVIKPRKKRASKHDFKDGRGRVFAHRHTFGKGWVEDTAKVDDSVYVGPDAQIWQFAKVSGNVRLEGQSCIFGHATVSGSTVLKKQASIYGRAVVQDNALLTDSASVYDNAALFGACQLTGAVRIREHARVHASSINGDVNISGEATVFRACFTGNIRMESRAMAINATIWGRASLQGYSQLLNSTLHMFHSTGVTMSDFAIVADSSQINVPLILRQHALVVRSIFTGSNWNLDANNNPGIFTLEGQVVISNRRFSDVGTLVSFLRVPTTPQNGQNVPANYANMRAPVSVQPAQRRVMRLEVADAT